MARFATALILLLAGSASAADFPTSISGDYVGGGYACRVSLAPLSTGQHHQFIAECGLPDGGRVALNVTALGCVTDYSAFGGLTSADAMLWGRLTGYGATGIGHLGTLTLLLGDQATVQAGGGTPLTLYRYQHRPFTVTICGGPPVPGAEPINALSLARWCRQHPDIPACKP